MRFRILRGLPVLALLAGAFSIGMTAHAAPAVSMAKLCSHGAYVLYMDDSGDQFASEAACVAWTRQHPGTPPIAIDDDPDGHPDQPADVDTDTSDNQPADADTDTTDDQPADVSTDDPDDQSSGQPVLVVVTDPTDDGATVTNDADSSDDGSAVTDDDSGGESVVIGDDSSDGEG